jgi:aspartate racemase
MAHAGILAHSPDGSALCYLEFIRLGHRRYGSYGNADVTMDYIPLGRSMSSWDAADYGSIRKTLAISVERLKRAGAEFFLCPDNTAHIALESAGPALALPGLHIAEIVADEARHRRCRRVAVLGTRYTMDGPVYPRALSTRGIACNVPGPRERETINRIIFNELCDGIVTDVSREMFISIISQMKARGCDAVALACTEIPLVVTADNSPLPVLDSTRLLAKAAFEVTTSERPMPNWRGGPV